MEGVSLRYPSARVLLLAPRPDDCDWSDHIAEIASVCRRNAPKRGVEARDFCRKLLEWGHETPFEFVTIQIELETSRAVAMELLRHRLCSFMMESQRSVSYASELPLLVHPDIDVTASPIPEALKRYQELIADGVKKEDARLILPETTACGLIIGMNLREFRHILKLRLSPGAWSEMRVMAGLMKDVVSDSLPEEERFLLEV